MPIPFILLRRQLMAPATTMIDPVVGGSYRRPDAISVYYRPGGISGYKRP